MRAMAAFYFTARLENTFILFCDTFIINYALRVLFKALGRSDGKSQLLMVLPKPNSNMYLELSIII